MCSTTTFLKGSTTASDSHPALIDNHGRRITYLSLDTLCRFRFKEITGSDHLDKVLDTFYSSIRLNILYTLKIRLQVKRNETGCHN